MRLVLLITLCLAMPALASKPSTLETEAEGDEISLGIYRGSQDRFEAAAPLADSDIPAGKSLNCDKW